MTAQYSDDEYPDDGIEALIAQLDDLHTEEPERIIGEEDPFVRASHNHVRDGGITPSKTNRGCVAYVVFNGRIKGVHKSWESCNYAVSGFPQQNYRGYRSLEEAEQAWITALEKDIVGNPPLRQKIAPTAEKLSSSINKQISSTSKPLSTSPVKYESSQPKEKAATSSSKMPSSSRPTVSSSTRSFWWVVLRGTKPGIYENLSAAQDAAGTHSFVRVERLGTREKAELLWENALAAGRVALLPSD
ncbi:hypothetical protein VNI00_018623 [Paramarasmius palmivorus]|uniref:Ribonuclease H1 N-terminal domain-containing protein n=1 Tax=Paramarasmius palmivorus TaxID=297713 RepID=A0AAW0AZ60_9AGAR